MVVVDAEQLLRCSETWKSSRRWNGSAMLTWLAPKETFSRPNLSVPLRAGNQFIAPKKKGSFDFTSRMEVA